MNTIKLSLAVCMVAGVVALVGLSQKPTSAEVTFGGVTDDNSSNTAIPPHTGKSEDAVPEGLTGSDWNSILQEYERHRHEAVSVEGGFRARNPGQQWLTHFDGRGFAVEPNSAGWRWGLELQSYGFPGHQRDISGQAKMTAHNDRVTYDWDAGLREWFVNDRRGLEHGFTLDSRPPGAGDPRLGAVDHKPGAGDSRMGTSDWLEFRLAVRGGLRAKVYADGRGVRFVDQHGSAVVNYAGLKVWDADHRELPAKFDADDADAAGLRLVVDERGARYPLTIDPIAQQAYLKASNTDTQDYFGRSVGVSGDTVVVGAIGESSNATGVNGNGADNSAVQSGAAYVFAKSAGGDWSQQAYLKASNTGGNDGFGWSVGVSGDTVVVGSIREASNAMGVNGNEADNGATNSGAAYVFVRDSASVWSQQAYLKASNADTIDQFGYSVGVSGDTVVVGAWLEDSNAAGVNGNQADNSARESGAAYVFVRDGGSDWSQQAYLKATNTGADDRFGFSVSVSSDTVVVGAFREASNATGVNGNGADNSAVQSGAAYVFVKGGVGDWSQQAYFKASNTDAGDQFGWSVGVSGDTAVVGALREDSNATGVNGEQADNIAVNSGAAYVFVRDAGGAWSQQAYLKASNTGATDFFGISVGVSGDTVVVGSALESSNATGVGGDQGDNSASGSGAAYVFVRDAGGVWSQRAYLKASNTDAGDVFGGSVAVSGETVVVGARDESSNATGLGGNQSDNSAIDSGAAYVFLITPSVCGDGIVEDTEQCDDSGESALCDADCTFVVCGDGTLNATAGEACDDGDVADGDGCSFACTIEPDFACIGEPSVCGLDCNGNGVPDTADLAADPSQDCNTNDIPDECDIADGTSVDCDMNAVPDECEVELDTDGDSILDVCDACLDSDMRDTIVIQACNTGVGNVLLDDGCTMADLIAACAVTARYHRQHVSCVARLSNNWRRWGLISGKDVGRIVSCTGSSGRDTSKNSGKLGTRRGKR